MLRRDTWAQIDLDALKRNLARYKEKTEKHILVILKANAYGHGDVMVARYASEWGYDFFGVSSMDEALHLRENGIPGSILIVGPANPADAALAIRQKVILCAASLSFAESLPQDCGGLEVHIAVDTGMNRIGFKDPEEVRKAIRILEDKHVLVSGIFSHYAKADEPGDPMTRQQLERFREVVESSGHQFRWIHIANSDGALSVKDDFTNMVRIGIGIYGYSEYEEMEPVLSLYSRLSMIKQVPAGQTISYGGTYTTKEDCWIGTMPIGYADGWRRANQGRLCWIKGNYVPFVGRICMDQCMVKLPQSYPIGTKVELIGPHMPLRTVAKELDTIPHEVLTLLSERVSRFYIYNEKTAGTNAGRFEYDVDVSEDL